MPISFSVPSLALPGKVAIITGGGTGMGRSMALEFAKAGADIVVASRTVANLERVAAEVRALDRRALAIRTDVSPEDRHGPHGRRNHGPVGPVPEGREIRSSVENTCVIGRVTGA